MTAIDLGRREFAPVKSPEAFRTISEVAVDLDVPQHVLRFWESKFAQIKPLKRAGGRRYYRPDDVALLRGIRELLYGDGYTIKGVQKLIRDQGTRHVMRVGRPQAGEEEEGADAPLATPLPPAPAPVLPPPEAALRSITAEQRARLEVVLGDLLDLKARLDERRQRRARA